MIPRDDVANLYYQYRLRDDITPGQVDQAIRRHDPARHHFNLLHIIQRIASQPHWQNDAKHVALERQFTLSLSRLYGFTPQVMAHGHYQSDKRERETSADPHTGTVKRYKEYIQ
jgi:hypothetical protein